MAQKLADLIPDPGLAGVLTTQSEKVVYGATLEDMKFLGKFPFTVPAAAGLDRRSGTVTLEAFFWIPQAPTSETRDGIIRQALGSFKNMKGLLYWSDSRQRMETLIHESYRISREDSRTPLADQGIPQGGLKTLLFQKDNTFGENVYTVEVKDQNQEFLFTLANRTKMYWGIIPLVDPGQFKMRILVKPLEDGVLIYGLASVSTLSFFGLERSKEDSFYNRLKALSTWVKNRLVQGNR